MTLEEFKAGIHKWGGIMRRHNLLPEEPVTSWVGGNRARKKTKEAAEKRISMNALESYIGEND